MSYFDLPSSVAADFKATDTTIRTHLSSEVALVGQIAEYIIQAGGKRLRPILVLTVARACGYGTQATQTHHHTLAAVIELIHTATLLHDDVVDESDLRRGRKTANAMFGNAASVLVGDFLYSRAFQMMVGVGRMDVMQVLSDATNIISEGEVLQLMNIGDADVSTEQYLTVIRYKTAKLFEAAARLGAMLADAPQATVEAMATLGMHLGTAFQLIDDVLDYAGDTEAIGKNVGDDLREGKPTLPILHALSHGSPEAQTTLRQVIETSGAAIDDGSIAFAHAMALVQDSGGIAFARAAAHAEADLAAAALAVLPTSEFKTALLKLCASSVGRTA